MSDEPTAWEDINPTTALAPRPEPRVPSSDRLKPATNIEFRNELTACLALVVPVGMTEEGRREWLAVAWETLKHLPADLLAIGCKKARETCDHPSKIVPAILGHVEDMYGCRRDAARIDPARTLPPPPVRPVRDETPMTPAEVEEMNAIMAKIKVGTRYRPDGSRYEVETSEGRQAARCLRPRHNPTRSEYIEMGVAPAVLDAIAQQGQKP